MASLWEQAAEQRGAGGGLAMALDRPWVAGPSSSVGARGRATTEGRYGARGMDGATECPERRDVTKQQPKRK